jgi:hypothetical protein
MQKLVLVAKHMHASESVACVHLVDIRFIANMQQVPSLRYVDKSV